MSKNITNDLAKRKMATAESVNCFLEVREYCLNEGLDEKAFKRIKCKVMANDYTLSFIKSVVEKYKKEFEALGYGPDDLIEYFHENLNALEIGSTALKHNLALLDYAGVEEESIFKMPHLSYKEHDTNLLYAIIKWLKDSEDKTPITIEEINYYLTYLNDDDKKYLKEQYPFTKQKSNLIILRHETKLEANLKTNRNFAKGLK